MIFQTKQQRDVHIVDAPWLEEFFKYFQLLHFLKKLTYNLENIHRSKYAEYNIPHDSYLRRQLIAT